MVRAGCLDCLTEPGIVGGIVAGRSATLVRPARNDSAVRGPRGSFEAACPDQPAPPLRPDEKTESSPTQSLDPRLRGDDTAAMPKSSRTAFYAHASAQFREYHAVPWWGGLVRAGCLDCLTEPGIVGGIVAGRSATLVRPARNDSAVRGPRGSFEAA